MKVTSSYRAVTLACGLLLGVFGSLDLSAQTTNYTITVPAGHSFIANHLDHGGNTVAELIPNPPEGTLLLKFDSATQGWGTVDQFEFGAWAQPNETIRPGEGVHVATLTNFQVTFSGTAPVESALPELKPGWNLVSIPVPGTTPFPTPVDGDQIYVHIGAPWEFQLSQATNGMWEPPPAIGVGEGFWYFRNADPTNLQPVRSSIYVNNYVPFLEINARLSHWDGCRPQAPMDGSNYLGQVFAGPDFSSLESVGQPISFLSGSTASGYIDTGVGTVWNVRSLQPGAQAVVQMRFWDSMGGTITSYPAAVSAGVMVGSSRIFFQVLGGFAFGIPPTPPLSGVFGLQSQVVNGFLWFDFNTQPTDVRSVLGGQARFGVWMTGECCFTFQWQKSIDQLAWVDLGSPIHISGVWTSEYTIQSVTSADVGFYRVVVSRGGPSCVGIASNPVTLTLPLLVLPQLTSIDIDRTNGTAAASFLLNGEPGHDYRIESSTNLTQWQTLTTFSNAVLPKLIGDTNNVPDISRYYRAKVLDP